MSQHSVKLTAGCVMEAWMWQSEMKQLMMCFLSADECGIVAQISEPLATADIPAYYISTFKFDHALVRPVDSPRVWHYNPVSDFWRRHFVL